MMKKILGVAMVAALLAAAAVAAPSCSQPKINCLTGHGGYAVTYTLKPGSLQGVGTCDQLKGEVIGLEKFNPSQPADPMKQDLDVATLAMRAYKVGGIADEVETTPGAPMIDESRVDAIGDFDAIEPNDKDVCTVPTLSPSSIDTPSFDLGIPCGGAMDEECPYPSACTMGSCVQPVASISYAFSNVRVLVTTAYEGVVFAADLTYTDATQGCSADYTLLGLYPLIPCSTDADCDPVADPDAGRVVGSGINPDFADNIHCDMDATYVTPGSPRSLQHFCTLKSPPASLK